MNSKSSSRKDAKPGTKDNLFQTPTTASGARGGQVSRTQTPNQFAFSKEQKHLNSAQTRRSCAPVKKIPNVHSVASLPSAVGTDPQVVWRQLVQERQRNKILQVETLSCSDCIPLDINNFTYSWKLRDSESPWTFVRRQSRKNVVKLNTRTS